MTAGATLLDRTRRERLDQTSRPTGGSSLKHGMEVVGFWTPAEGPDAKNTGAKNTLYYILAFPSIEAQKKAWQEFRSDPEWIKVKADSEKDGSLVNKVDSTNLKATDYSAMK